MLEISLTRISHLSCWRVMSVYEIRCALLGSAQVKSS
jgi:hypothetical protein